MAMPMPLPIPICHHGSRYSRHVSLLLLLVASRSSSGFRPASFISIGTSPRYGTVSGQNHGMLNIGQSRRRNRFAMTTTSTPPEEGSHSQEEGIQAELEQNEDEHLHPKNGDSDSGSNDDSKNQNQECIYLDYNGTTPIYKRVLQAMMPYFTTHFGNPSSSHYYGQEPKEAIAKARMSILSLLYENRDRHVVSAEYQNGVIFTGCGTEADNLAIHLALEANRQRFEDYNTWDQNEDLSSSSFTTPRIPHIITSNVEHPAIAQYLKALESEGRVTVTYVPVDKEGIVPAEEMKRAIDDNQDNTILVTLMLANNESGALQPVKEIADYCKTKKNGGILFHTDAAQAVGKVSLLMDADNDTDSDNDNDTDANTNYSRSKSKCGMGNGVDMVTIVGHKFGAPKGIACLYVKPLCFVGGGGSNNEQQSLMQQPRNYMLLGGGQEGGQRAGTENVPYIVAMGTAADILMEQKEFGDMQWQQNAHWMKAMRYRLYKRLVAGLGDDVVRDNGPARHFDRLPNTLSVGLKGINASEMLDKIRMRVACSAGSACHSSGCGDGSGSGTCGSGSGSGSGDVKISAILEAMEIPIEYARGTLRLSVGPDTTEAEIDQAGDIIISEAKGQLHYTNVM
uniref:Aminotransferase class V domain-containing protein n=1 Tax=Chaetoceros debilis TaxID=122233 RepID=A0A7S3Q6W6_9STRA|mmetsp:Transcript_24088/g.36774  ORF Transcript_24088/g.36774 Transcript_24088/m.36774 type:complete len:623 (+) Transcript_24088:45-1913(+)